METEEKIEELEEKTEEKIEKTDDKNKELNNDKIALIFVCSLFFLLLVGAAIGVYLFNI